MYIDLVTINLCPGQGGGGVKPSGTLEISENGVYNVYSYASASVDVHPSESLSETYLSNGSYTITGEFNGGVITVDVPSSQFVTEILNVSANGTYNPGEGVDGYSQVVVDVHPSTSLSETYISNGNYNITGEFNGGVITVDVPAPQFVTETLNVSANGTYNPGQGIDGYSQVVVDVPISGWDQKSFTEGTVEIINLDNSASFVASEAFKNNKTIQTVNLPYATSVDNSAFGLCVSLTQVNLPMCEYIGDYTFQYCNSLSQISLTKCSYIGNYTFQYCNSLSQISFPMCSYIGNSTFYSCRSLTQVDLPMCEYIGMEAFGYCTALTQVSLPVCKYISNSGFFFCRSLTQVSLPVC